MTLIVCLGALFCHNYGWAADGEAYCNRFPGYVVSTPSGAVHILCEEASDAATFAENNFLSSGGVNDLQIYIDTTPGENQRIEREIHPRGFYVRALVESKSLSRLRRFNI